MNLEFEGKEDHYTFLDSSELRSFIANHPEAIKRCKHDMAGYGGRGNDWSGGLTFDAAMQCLTTGDNALVAQSDALLAKLEDKLPQTRKWQKIDHYTGVRVKITSHLAGLPKSMRKRKKLDRDDAPVTIFMDLTSSAIVSASDLLKRGIAILALARCLVQHRPVELWAGVSLGEGGYRGKAWSSTLGWRIDTAPMDLARAAFLLAHPAVARGLGYGTAPIAAGHTSWNGQWSWSNHSLHVKTQAQRLRNAMGASEMLVIPPIYGTDPLVTDPVGWISRELERLLGQGGEVGSEEWNKEIV